MATAVYDVLEVELQDGSTVELKPLPIKALKKFMKKVDELGGTDDQEKFIDICLDAAIICLAKQKPEFVGDEGVDLASEALDMETVYKILDVCGGVKLNDPKLMEAALEMAKAQQAAGQN
jgi:hypothetical protein